MSVCPYKRADLRVVYEAAQSARRSYEDSKATQPDDPAFVRAWQRGWKDAGRELRPELAYRGEVTP